MATGMKLSINKIPGQGDLVLEFADAETLALMDDQVREIATYAVVRGILKRDEIYVPGGLPLRDTFAVAAMGGILAAAAGAGLIPTADENSAATRVAASAYAMADAMLAARDRKAAT